MSYNGSGAFSIDSTGQPVVEDTTISSSVFNDFTADIATGLSTAICKDGQTTITANIPLSTFKLTGVGNGTDRQDAATIANIVAGTGVYVGTVGGTANAITLTPSPAITAYAAGQQFRFIAGSTNTSNVTVNISSLGNQAVTKNGTTALVAGDILSGSMVTITYDGTRFILNAYMPTSSTWTPTLTFESAGDQSIAYTTQTGLYIKVGKLVLATFMITTSTFTHSTATGTLRITGLPFTSAAARYYGTLGFQGITAAGYTQCTPFVSTSTTTIFFALSGSGQSESFVSTTDAPSGGTVILNGSVMYEATT